MAARDHFLEKILDEKPSLNELCEHIRLGTKWYVFGVLLKLDEKKLEAIDQDPNKRLERKVLQMFQLWLNTTANATRRQVIDTLAKEVIGEIVLAENYTKAIREREDPDNLSTLLSHYNLSRKELERECDDGLFIEISQHVNDYTSVGDSLNLSRDTLEKISQEKKTGIARKNAVLWAWKRKNGSAATAIELVKVFLKLEDRFVAELILKYLSKETTSEEHQMPCILVPEKAKECYPNWAVLTESEQEAVKNRLMDENRDVREAYTFFIIQLIDSFKEREVDPNDVQSLVHSFGALEGSQQLPAVFNFADTSISGVFSELTKHCTWFNYELFQVIVKYKGEKAEKQYLKTYEDDHLTPYLNRSIFEIPCTSCHDQSQCSLLLFKVSGDLYITGKEVKAIQRNLAKLLGLKNSALLHFENYNDGCIELVFSLPRLIFTESSPKSQMLTYTEWDESLNCYRVNTDIVNVLSYSEKAEVSLFMKLLQEKEDALSELTVSLEREVQKQRKQLTLQEHDDVQREIHTHSSQPGRKHKLIDPVQHEIKKPAYDVESYHYTQKRKSDSNFEDEKASKKPLLDDVANNQTTVYLQHETATVNQTDQELKHALKEMEDAHRKEIAQKDQKINDLKHALKDMEDVHKEEIALKDLEINDLKDSKEQESKIKKKMSRELEEIKYLKNPASEVRQELEVERDIPSINWDIDSTVTLNSPTVKECEEFMSQLKGKQQPLEIFLKRSSTDSVLAVLDNIGVCTVKKLHIWNSPLDSDCVSKLSHILECNKTIEYLCLKLSPLLKSLEIITAAVSKNTTLKTFKIWFDSTITDKDVPHICQMISINTTLQQLSLINCHNITNDGREQLQKCSTKSKTLDLQVVFEQH